MNVFDRLYATRSGVLVGAPVRFDVWRAYAADGPMAPQPLILTRSEEQGMPASSLIARRMQEAAHVTEEVAKAVEPLPVGTIGEWVYASATLGQLIYCVLPFTRWNRHIQVLARLDETAVAHLLTPLGVLIREVGQETTGSSANEERASGDRTVTIPFDERDQEIMSWLARMLVFMNGFDPDNESSRPNAARDLLERLRPVLSTDPPYGANPWREQAVIEAVSVDRKATFAVTGASVVDSGAPVPPSIKVIKADAARRLFNIDTSHQTWAVIDSGINARHPAFADLAAPAMSRIDETFDLTALSDEQLGTLPERDDAIFEHLVDLVQSTAVPSWRSGVTDSVYVEPADPHGTHVAGILAGHWPNTFQGVCPDLRLWDLRALHAGAGNESRILVALRFIRYYNERAGKIVISGANLSVQIGYDPRNHACGWTPICEEVRRLVRSGVVVVVAAGNSGYRQVSDADLSPDQLFSRGSGFEMVSITDPANTEEAIAVGATHSEYPHRYGTSYFSAKGPTADGRPKPDLLAPGERIAGPAGRNRMYVMDGTSQAAPHVSGAAALLIGRHPELRGQPERIKEILCASATDLARSPHFQGHGLIDVLRAIQSV
jgi:Subtilase family